MSVNAYSDTWFELFLRGASRDVTAHETAFVRRCLPRPPYQHVFDLCCGDGRHCEVLAGEGYRVTGYDRNREALAAAQLRCPSGRFVEGDMRNLSALEDEFDAVICLWQSFGYFDDGVNTNVLRQIRNRLASHGRLILDIYNPAFFRHHQGTRTFMRNEYKVTESKSIVGNRLRVELDYGPPAIPDRFDWRLYEADELCGLAKEIGFDPIACCENFDEDQTVSANVPRMQMVFGVRP